MLSKLLGCTVIIMCAGKIGFDEAARFSSRVTEIRELQTALVSLIGEIELWRTPLATALIRTGGKLKTEIRQLFLKAGEKLKNDNISVDEVWECVILKE
ncbi:MAG: hypothetical protein GX800_08955 [Clostridiaceae bacterium]|nr:hypothetical protein [Clostridiaceae bacterium]